MVATTPNPTTVEYDNVVDGKTEYEVVSAIQDGETWRLGPLYTKYKLMVEKHCYQCFSRFRDYDESLKEDFRSEAYLALYDAVMYVDLDRIYTPDSWKIVQVFHWYLGDLKNRYRRALLERFNQAAFDESCEVQTSVYMNPLSTLDDDVEEESRTSIDRSSEARIQRFWNELSDRHRTIVHMMIDGWGIHEIAEELGLTYATAQGRVWEVKKWIVPKVFGHKYFISA